MRRAELAVVRRAPHILRTLPRHGFPRGVLQVEQWRGVHAGWLLQFHTQKEPERGTRERIGAEHEEVVEDERQR